MAAASATSPTIGIIAGGGVLPFAAAEAIRKRGTEPFLFAIKGFCDPERVKAFPHHWVALGQFGRLSRLMRAENCRDVVFIGGLVRPALSEIRLDFGTLRIIPQLAKAMRGGDDHLLKGVAAIFEQDGFHLVGIKDVAPELLMPEGTITQLAPDADMKADIAKGRELLRTLGPYDVGQAAVVIDGHAVAIEDIEGTDGLLARVARLRSEGRIRGKPGLGVLVKAPKLGQDLRFDLPTFGPKTVDGLVAAGLAGAGIAAGQALVAEPQAVVEKADKAGLIIVGMPA